MTTRTTAAMCLLGALLAGCDRLALPTFNFIGSDGSQYKECKCVAAPVTSMGQKTSCLRTECEVKPRPRD